MRRRKRSAVKRLLASTASQSDGYKTLYAAEAIGS
jgi:hypothetical protein